MLTLNIKYSMKVRPIVLSLLILILITGTNPARFRAVGTGRLSIMDKIEAMEVLELEVIVPEAMVDTEVKEEAEEVTVVAEPVTVAVEDTQPEPEDPALVEAVDPVEVTEAAVMQGEEEAEAWALVVDMTVEEVEARAQVEDMTVAGVRVAAETTTKDTRQAHEELTDTEVEVGQFKIQ